MTCKWVSVSASSSRNWRMSYKFILICGVFAASRDKTRGSITSCVVVCQCLRAEDVQDANRKTFPHNICQVIGWFVTGSYTSRTQFSWFRVELSSFSDVFTLTSLIFRLIKCGFKVFFIYQSEKFKHRRLNKHQYSKVLSELRFHSENVFGFYYSEWKRYFHR